MRPAVFPAFVALSERIEGVARWPYLDVRGLVTTSVGVLVDDEASILALPWRIGDRLAERWEVLRDFHRIGSRQDLASVGGMAIRQQAVTSIRLDELGVQAAVRRKIAEAEVRFRRRWPDWETRSADAQLLALLLAWAMGAAGACGEAPGEPGNCPRFAEAFAAHDYETAGRESHISEAGNPGVRPRNEAMALAAANAAVVEGAGLDPDVLHYPAAVSAGPSDTLPAPAPLVVPDTLDAGGTGATDHDPEAA